MIEIKQETYDEIKQLIGSDNSPVGIDAVKTHVFILHKLLEIEKKIDALSE